jgi:O-6-methylguanine DNA methyltransferase
MSMSESVRFESLRLADAARLRLAANQLAGSRSLTEIRQVIRHFQQLCPNQLWLLEQQEIIQGVAGFQMIDPLSRRAVLHLYPAAEADSIPIDILTAIFDKAFQQCNIFRLELPVPADAAGWQPAVRKAGMTEEGRLRFCRFDAVTRRHQDVLLYSMLRPESPRLNTAIVPFRLGILAITGNQENLLTTGFVKYGERFERAIQSECAEVLGLLDSHGNLVQRQVLEQLRTDRCCFCHPNTPHLVLTAAEQAADYFAGRLARFDLPLDLSCGSSFQQRVWRLLSEIPYGATWTYEELAHRLDQEDWPAARRMARAVGSACSANPLPLILPCHRVIGKDGRLVGFTGGLDIKEYLLAHEIMGVND